MVEGMKFITDNLTKNIYYSKFIEFFVCAWHCAAYFMWIVSFDCLNSSVREILLVSPFHRLKKLRLI